MISIYSIIVILITHYISDFVFQNDWMARGKSKHNLNLIVHTSVYTLVSMILLLCFIKSSPVNIIWFALVNGVAHGFIDYFTSRWSSALFEKNAKQSTSPYKFTFGPFTVIGLDQLIHYIILFSLYGVFLNA